jgi:hypothetical protein
VDQLPALVYERRLAAPRAKVEADQERARIRRLHHAMMPAGGRAR